MIRASSVWLIWWRIQAFWTDTSSIHAKQFYHHFLILISMWYSAMFWSISLIKPMPWLQQWNWFGWEVWMNFWSILLQQQTNSVDCDGIELEAMYTVQLLFHPVTVIHKHLNWLNYFYPNDLLDFFQTFLAHNFAFIGLFFVENVCCFDFMLTKMHQ